jgi:membrane protease YdiL (CAAX protease family)
VDEAAMTKSKQIALLLAPPLVLLSMWTTFSGLQARFGAQRGHLVGLLGYWAVWCGCFPWWILGSRGLRACFSTGRPRGWDWMLLSAAPLLGYSAAFPKQAKRADMGIVATSAAMAAVNGVGEELLWRGAYLGAFPCHTALAQAYATLGFALWHLAPQRIFPSRYPGGAWSFVAVSGALGWLYSIAARREGGIRWTALSHALFDFSGLGALVYQQR